MFNPVFITAKNAENAEELPFSPTFSISILSILPMIISVSKPRTLTGRRSDRFFEKKP
jgi:hypothetical protein